MLDMLLDSRLSGGGSGCTIAGHTLSVKWGVFVLGGAQLGDQGRLQVELMDASEKVSTFPVVLFVILCCMPVQRTFPDAAFFRRLK